MGIIRIIRKIVMGRNHEDNTVDHLGESGEVHNLSDQTGAMESTYYETAQNQRCGCYAPPGGRCSECGAVSCPRCHQHCGGTENPSPLGCGKPLCREHSHYIPVADGKAIPFCGRCYGKITRKQNRKRITGLLLLPFIEQERKNEQ
jgi:hypothetical protein